MTREEFYTSRRSEGLVYKALTEEDMAPVPLTREGFEALCQRVAEHDALILDDGVRSIIAGYIHHVPSNEIVFSFQDLCKVAYKNLSNNLTFTIDQEMKIKAKEEYAKAHPENVLPIKKEENGPKATS